MPRSDHFTSSSYDPDAHLARKRSTHWIGYKVHLTESCEENQPDLLEWLPALLPMAIWRQISIKL